MGVYSLDMPFFKWKRKSSLLTCGAKGQSRGAKGQSRGAMSDNMSGDNAAPPQETGLSVHLGCL